MPYMIISHKLWKNIYKDLKIILLLLLSFLDSDRDIEHQKCKNNNLIKMFLFLNKNAVFRTERCFNTLLSLVFYYFAIFGAIVLLNFIFKYFHIFIFS